MTFAALLRGGIIQPKGSSS